VSGERERICEAMLDLVSEQGYEATGLDEVLARAGVPRGDFERLFGSMQECAVFVFESFMAECIGATRRAYDSKAEWPDSLRAAAYALARWLKEHPREVRFGAVEMLWVSELSQARRELAFQTFAELADGGRAVAEDPDSVPAFSGEAVVGSVAKTLAKRAQQKGTSPYEFVPQLMYLAVLPYLGEEAAEAELRIPAPEWARGA
jgi:AcrR family transcriptional regulator